MNLLVALTTHNRQEEAKRTAGAVLIQLEDLSIPYHVVLANSGEGINDLGGAGSITQVMVPFDSFWSDSNRIILEYAESNIPDWSHLVLINEDVELSGKFIEEALGAFRSLESLVAVCANTLDSNGQKTYGGHYRPSNIWGLSLLSAPISTEIEQVDTFNGNLVVVARTALDGIGGWPGEFRHLRADIVLGWRLSRIGLAVQLPGAHGKCEANEEYLRVFRSKMKLRDRLGYFSSPKGYPPREHFKFTSEIGGWMWPLYFCGPYLRLAISITRNHFLRKFVPGI